MAMLFAGGVIILLLVLVLHLTTVIHELNARLERINMIVVRMHRERN
jgi:hypothetical protein